MTFKYCTLLQASFIYKNLDVSKITLTAAHSALQLKDAFKRKKYLQPVPPQSFLMLGVKKWATSFPL